MESMGKSTILDIQEDGRWGLMGDYISNWNMGEEIDDGGRGLVVGEMFRSPQVSTPKKVKKN